MSRPSPLRIAVLYGWNAGSRVGGVQSYIADLSAELRRLGHQIRVFRPSLAPPDPGEHAFEFYPVIGPAWLRKLAAGCGLALNDLAAAYAGRVLLNLMAGRAAAAVVDWQPDVVWQQDLSSSWLATRVLSRHYPVVLTNHTGEYLFLSRLSCLRPLVGLMLGHYADIIGPSEELTPQRPGAHYVPNGADERLFVPLSASERVSLRSKVLGAGSTRFVVFCPRRWAPTKGVLYLAQALPLLAKRGFRERLAFVFAGDADRDYPDYHAQIEQSLAQEHFPVIRLGNVNRIEMSKFLSMADLTVIPSLMEAVSISAVESMLCGTAVGASKVGGMPDLISDGDTGYLFDSGSASAVADVIARAASEPQLHQQIAARGRSRAVAQFSLGAVTRRTEAVLVAAVASYRATQHQWRGARMTIDTSVL